HTLFADGHRNATLSHRRDDSHTAVVLLLGTWIGNARGARHHGGERRSAFVSPHRHWGGGAHSATLRMDSELRRSERWCAADRQPGADDPPPGPPYGGAPRRPPVAQAFRPEGFPCDGKGFRCCGDLAETGEGLTPGVSTTSCQLHRRHIATHDQFDFRA